MNAYQCTVAYEGTRYNGWQKQGNTANTIQEKIETLLSKMLDESIEIHGSGRTDAGVHALGQVFHFHCNATLEDDFLTKANAFLPKDIRICTLNACDLRFHARLNAVAKTYQYQIDTSTYGNPFIRHTSHHIPSKLDIEAIKKGSQYLIGTHDFKSFCSNKRMKKSSVRTIYSIDIQEDTDRNLLLFTFCGNGFLYNMVRILSGTLIEIGLGLRAPETLPDILEGCNRGLAGHTAPACGLTLVSVKYDHESHQLYNNASNSA